MRRQLLNKFAGNFSWIVIGLPVTSCGIAVAYLLADACPNPVPPASTGWMIAICRNGSVTLAATGYPLVICQTETPSSSDSVTYNNLRVLFYAQVRHPAVMYA